MADVEELLKVLHKLVDDGNTVIVIEHNMSLVADADYVVDVGPVADEEAVRIHPEVPGAGEQVIPERAVSGHHEPQAALPPEHQSSGPQQGGLSLDRREPSRGADDDLVSADAQRAPDVVARPRRPDGAQIDAVVNGRHGRRGVPGVLERIRHPSGDRDDAVGETPQDQPVQRLVRPDFRPGPARQQLGHAVHGSDVAGLARFVAQFAPDARHV